MQKIYKVIFKTNFAVIFICNKKSGLYAFPTVSIPFTLSRIIRISRIQEILVNSIFKKQQITLD